MALEPMQGRPETPLKYVPDVPDITWDLKSSYSPKFLFTDNEMCDRYTELLLEAVNVNKIKIDETVREQLLDAIDIIQQQLTMEQSCQR